VLGLRRNEREGCKLKELVEVLRNPNMKIFGWSRPDLSVVSTLNANLSTQKGVRFA